jgi:hypothetical protein
MKAARFGICCLTLVLVTFLSCQTYQAAGPADASDQQGWETPTIRFAEPPSSRPAIAGADSIALHLSAPARDSVLAEIAMLPASDAREEYDYTLSGKTVAFAPGDSVAFVMIDILNDSAFCCGGSFVLKMAEVHGAGIDAPFTYRYAADADSARCNEYVRRSAPLCTVHVAVEGRGQVSLSPAGGVYRQGKAVSLEALGEDSVPGWEFSHWGGPANGTSGSVSIKAHKSRDTVIAHYRKIEPSGDNILCVNHAAVGANDGENWADAFNTIQEAIESSAEGDEIWVAKGDYLIPKLCTYRAIKSKKPFE